MDVVAAFLQHRDSDTPLVIETDPDGFTPPRLIAELFHLAEGGLVFADIGWAVPANPAHPFHWLQPLELGTESCLWRPADEAWIIREPFPGLENEDRAIEQWDAWRERRQELRATRERARAAAHESAVGGPTALDPTSSPKLTSYQDRIKRDTPPINGSSHGRSANMPS